ncbi:MAG: GxxExxY protein [Thermodesulfobacteriota bacterium]
MRFEDLTAKIIGGAYRVHNRMGFGFLESVYEKCLMIQLRRGGLNVEAHPPIAIQYEGEPVGEFFPDLLVEREVVVELKAARRLAPAHEAQLVHYLVAMGKEIGLLINFGERRVEVKRKHRDPPRPDEDQP